METLSPHRPSQVHAKDRIPRMDFVLDLELLENLGLAERGAGTREPVHTGLPRLDGITGAAETPPALL